MQPNNLNTKPCFSKDPFQKQSTDLLHNCSNRDAGYCNWQNVHIRNVLQPIYFTTCPTPDVQREFTLVP